MDGGVWWAAVHGVAKSQTWLSDFTFTFHFHALEKEMATHSSVLAWRIPGMGEPGGRPSMGSHRVGHHWSDLAVAEARQEIQARISRGPCCSPGEEGVRTHKRFPCLCALPVGGDLSLYGGRVEVRPGVRLEAWVRCFAHPSVVLRAGVHAQCIAFAPNTVLCSQLFRNGNWFCWVFFFWSLYLLVQNLSQLLHACSYF